MIRLLILFVLALMVALSFTTAAQAATAQVSWQLPTTNIDGSPIPATGPGSIAAARVEWGSCLESNVFGTAAGEVVVAAPANTTTVINLAAATTYCFRVFARNTYGAESGPSNTAAKAIPTPVPGVPTDVTVEVVL